MLISKLLKYFSFPMIVGSSFSSQAQLVNYLESTGVIKSLDVKRALLEVDRKNYCSTNNPYTDSPQPIGCGQTISAPHMHAYALELLAAQAAEPTANILDVGCGSGYLTAVFARYNPTAFVVGIDYFEDQVNLSKTNIAKKDRDLLESGRLQLHTCNGWRGYQELAPYNAIHVGAAAESIPEDLLLQLKVQGRMIIPVGQRSAGEQLLVVDRLREGSSLRLEDFKIRSVLNVSYVPLLK